jgi:hypothetical protein
MGVQEPPQQNSGRNHHQPDCLIAAKEAGLYCASFLFGDLFKIRLNVTVVHASPDGVGPPPRLSIGEVQQVN